jgi:hypothetical protein
MEDRSRWTLGRRAGKEHDKLEIVEAAKIRYFYETTTVQELSGICSPDITEATLVTSLEFRST